MRVITLKPNGVGRYDDVSPFIIADNKLQLKFNLPTLNGEFYLIYKNNGEKVKRLLPGNGEVTLGNLSAGEFTAAVKHYLKGVLIKEYKVESLIIVEVDGSISAEPEIAALRRELSELKETLSKEQETAAERGKTLVNLQKNQLALIRFAFNDYKDNPYLKGGSFESFIKEFGFVLDKETIKSIEGEMEDDKT